MVGHNFNYNYNNYRQKYLKYKTKYLELQSKLNNQSGGNLKTAKNSFFNKIFTNKDGIYWLLQSDIYLMKKLKDNNLTLPLDIGIKLEILKENPVLNEIFDIIVNVVDDKIVDDKIVDDKIVNDKIIDDKIVDEYIKMYLNGKLGEPNSIENVGHFIRAQKQLKKLRVNNQALKIKIPATFDSLTDLKDFITKNESNFELIDDKNKSKQKIIEKHKKIKEKGEDDVKIILSTSNVTVYHPTTEAGSKFYGSGTKWCTAATNDNKFSDYNKEAPLYIVIPKSDPKNKFQLFFDSDGYCEFMDASDNKVTITKLFEEINDKQFNIWFNSHLFNIVDGEVIIKDYLPIFTEEDNHKIKKVTFSISFNEPLGTSLDNLTSLQQLILGYSFNQPLGSSLNNLSNLQHLTFGYFFDKHIGSSLNNLTNLKQLTFGRNFNKHLGSSLNNLTNLQQLTFDNYFQQHLGTSLDNLKNLQSLSFGNNFNNGNQPLGSSLNRLIYLRQLTFGLSFNNGNQPLGSSLDRLVNLQQLTFGLHFKNGNQPLGSSLDSLVNLQKLTFGSHFDNGNQPLGSSLDKLINLQQLTFGLHFKNGNQPLGSSLDSLVKLEELTFGLYFNQPVISYIDKLGNLQKLTLSTNYQHPLPQKPNLKIIKV
jgi:hypothetical protein